MSDYRLLATPLAVAAACVAILDVSPGFAQVRPEPDALGHAAPALVDRLRDDAFAYFRFVNRPWTARVCDVFADDIRDLPAVRLHGDAHIEQFALTNDAWGLDDFDDAARGAALVDIVRFIGSVDLGSRLRGWTRDREMLFDRFFQGYRRGLSQPDVRPSQPAIVRHFRSQGTGPRHAFLAWGDAQMRTDDRGRDGDGQRQPRDLFAPGGPRAARPCARVSAGRPRGMAPPRCRQRAEPKDPDSRAGPVRRTGRTTS